MGIESLERLKVWKQAKEFSLKIYREALPILPPEEKWGLSQQLRRSAHSIPSNIAEGHGRFYFLDNVRFCYIARGSLEETISHIIFMYELGYIPEKLYLEIRQDGEVLYRLINGYIAYLKRSKQGASEPGALQALHESRDSYDVENFEEDNHD